MTGSVVGGLRMLKSCAGRVCSTSKEVLCLSGSTGECAVCVVVSGLYWGSVRHPVGCKSLLIHEMEIPDMQLRYDQGMCSW